MPPREIPVNSDVFRHGRMMLLIAYSVRSSDDAVSPPRARHFATASTTAFADTGFLKRQFTFSDSRLSVEPVTMTIGMWLVCTCAASS